jgi:rRNA pseudouridine-1189 N-methylase Emg1 (Nep1/Mra1 family)
LVITHQKRLATSSYLSSSSSQGLAVLLGGVPRNQKNSKVSNRAIAKMNAFYFLSSYNAAKFNTEAPQNYSITFLRLCGEL